MKKIAVFIPNEGHTQPESYDNRLVGHVRLGVVEGVTKILDAIRSAGLSAEQTGGIAKSLADLLPGYGSAFTSIIQTKEPFEFMVGTAGRMHAHIAREVLADHALQLGADYLFMIDDDMICPTDLFERLYERDVDIIAPLAFMRKPPHHPVIYTVREGWDPVTRQQFFQNFSVMTYPKDQLVECDAVGFGAVLIKMDVFRKLQKPWFATWSRIGEDIGFCHKAKKAGFRIFMDTSIKLGHLGDPIEVTEETYEKHMEVEKLRGAYPAETTGSVARMKAA